MNLDALLKDYPLKLPTYLITGLACDSRHVLPGNLFFALSGIKTDGRNYIDEAIKKGVLVILQEGPLSIEKQNNILFICLPDINKQVGPIASKFYDHPSHEMIVIGITGTNGKTSTCCLTARVLEKLGYKVGVIGTLGMGELAALNHSGMTTPDAITLQHQFHKFKKSGMTAVVMEVSSHALDQYRVDGIQFDAAIFTNLTRDHLDYHHTMENYAKAKRRLFNWPALKYAIINVDDKIGEAWINELSDQLSVCCYSLSRAFFSRHPRAGGDPIKIKKLFTQNLQLDLSGIHATLSGSFGKVEFHSELLGQFNVSNLLAVLSCLCMLGIPLDTAAKSLSECHGVRGRMQLVREKNKPLAVIDYAHTPDALEQVLITLRALPCKKIICVFGCGGDRDRGKRSLMAAIAEKYADLIIVTSDNPRSEEPETIAKEIVQGFHDMSKVMLELDRARAIALALKQAQEGDIVFIAGKGHETTQTIQGVVYPFDDVEVVKDIFSEN